MNVLILFAHPALEKSHVNKWLIKGLKEKEGVTFHDLYEEYPEFDINVQHEQELLLMHDYIIFHFPFFWYSTPAILKEWQDLVLEHGWAYGSKGNFLKGKQFMCAMTIGGPQDVYREDSFHKHTIRQLISPLRQTATLCQMNPLPPFAVHGAHRVKRDAIETYRKEYFKLLDEIIEGKFDSAKAAKFDYMNDYLAKSI
ncbi:NAD(P)H-dependent oxidoreductase [Sediminitomix flava]|uniref:Kef-type potassium/proton antiporter accessory protein (CPA2 family) n=1 Tax=Sediminitomix flava TaxID=379075 RepID=A0A315Z522_SEDFL|nr:NAD(P)H-dependent oxidoreductase [Sediminitomix flava]PWJ37983.1 Kef-type potassium/proton antiporter accessory protein (CPA2 family) [Sediminitomix flava]